MFNELKIKALKTEAVFNLELANEYLRRAGKAKTQEQFSIYMRGFNRCQNRAMKEFDKIKELNKDKIVKCRIKFKGAKA